MLLLLFRAWRGAKRLRAGRRSSRLSGVRTSLLTAPHRSSTLSGARTSIVSAA